MKPIKKTLTELAQEGYKIFDILPLGLIIYSKGTERALYDTVSEHIGWSYNSNSKGTTKIVKYN
jgi:hypothetical protein